MELDLVLLRSQMKTDVYRTTRITQPLFELLTSRCLWSEVIDETWVLTGARTDMVCCAYGTRLTPHQHAFMAWAPGQRRWKVDPFTYLQWNVQWFDKGENAEDVLEPDLLVKELCSAFDEALMASASSPLSTHRALQWTLVGESAFHRRWSGAQAINVVWCGAVWGAHYKRNSPCHSASHLGYTLVNHFTLRTMWCCQLEERMRYASSLAHICFYLAPQQDQIQLQRSSWTVLIPDEIDATRTLNTACMGNAYEFPTDIDIRGFLPMYK